MGGKIAGLCDLVGRVPSRRTPHIQEALIIISHAVCEAVVAFLLEN